jgi:hypothetical protein
MPTLEERVAALEAWQLQIENTKYEMTYSGQDLEGALDFVNERKLVSGRKEVEPQSSSGNLKIFAVTLDTKYSDYTYRPIIEFELEWYLSGGAINKVKPEKVLTKSTTEGGLGRINLTFVIDGLPTTSSSATYAISYVIMEGTDM